MESGDVLTKLYDSYNKLNDAGTKISQESETYKIILGCVKGTPKEKQLCIQFISKFFLNFPDLFNESIDSVLDMLEDEDCNIRSKAIREIPNICKKRKESVAGITDILSQMLMVEDQGERALVASSLITIANCDPKSFFQALFPHLEAEAELREQIIVFIRDKFNQIEKHLLTKEVEEFIFNGFMKIVTADCSENEFEVIMKILSEFNISKSLNGHNALLSIVKNKAELGKAFDVNNLEFIHKFLMCVEYGLKYFSKFSPSTDFVKYMCEQILPHYRILKVNPEFSSDLEILQTFAQISPFIHTEAIGETIQTWQDTVFDLLLAFVPKPPETFPEGDKTNGDLIPEFEFSHIESILFGFHQLCKFNTKYFETVSNSEILKDFKIRLQFLANGVNSFSSKLQRIRSTMTAEELKKPENQRTLTALKCSGNIKSLIMDFFKNPPCYKTTVKLSFQKEKGRFPEVQNVVSTPAKKRDSNPTVEIRKRPLITAPEGTSPPKKTRSDSDLSMIRNRTGFNNHNPYKKVNNSGQNNRNGSGHWRGGGGGNASFRGGFRSGGSGSFRGGRGRRW